MSSPSALITGAGKRVGRTLSLFLAERGYDLALHYNHSRPETAALADEIRDRYHREVEIFHSDLMDVSSLDPLMGAVHARFPHCNTLIHNASAFARAPFLDTTPDRFEEQMAVNLRAPFFLSQAFARRVGTGHIVMLLDTDITRNATNYFAYLLSKKSLHALVPMLAMALSPHIRVNAVCPGMMLPSGEEFGEEYMKEKAKKIPLQALATTEDIARTVGQLLEGFFTGQCVFVDGGESLL